MGEGLGHSFRSPTLFEAQLDKLTNTGSLGEILVRGNGLGLEELDGSWRCVSS